MLRATLLAVMVLAVAGCGGDSELSASEQYANDVCSSFSSWLTDVQSTAQSVTDAGLGTTKQDLQTAVDDVGNATDKLSEDLQAAGPPDSEDGQKASSEVESLVSQIREQLATVQAAVDSNAGILSIATTVSTAISTALSHLETTYNNLKDLDPAGELRDAFESSDDCNSLQDEVEKIRSS